MVEEIVTYNEDYTECHSSTYNEDCTECHSSTSLSMPLLQPSDPTESDSKDLFKQMQAAAPKHTNNGWEEGDTQVEL